jgi:membrane protein YdbS with pleckstrin-like domain
MRKSTGIALAILITLIAIVAATGLWDWRNWPEGMGMILFVWGSIAGVAILHYLWEMRRDEDNKEDAPWE